MTIEINAVGIDFLKNVFVYMQSNHDNGTQITTLYK